MHVGDAFFEEGDALRVIRERQKAYFRSQVKRKLGAVVEEVAPAPRKRRRVKTYLSILIVDNCLRVSAGARLTDFKPPVDENGNFEGPPFTWKCLSLATDSGPDMALPLSVASSPISTES